MVAMMELAMIMGGVVIHPLQLFSLSSLPSSSLSFLPAESLSPSANLIRSVLSLLHPSACVLDTKRGSEKQRAGKRKERYVLPFSFSV